MCLLCSEYHAPIKGQHLVTRCRGVSFASWRNLHFAISQFEVEHVVIHLVAVCISSDLYSYSVIHHIHVTSLLTLSSLPLFLFTRIITSTEQITFKILKNRVFISSTLDRRKLHSSVQNIILYIVV